MAPEYELFVNPITRTMHRGTLRLPVEEIRTAIIMHRGWTYRAGIYDKKNMTNGNSNIDMLENILVMHSTDPYTHSKGVWMSVYNDTAVHPDKQGKTLDSVYEITGDYKPPMTSYSSLGTGTHRWTPDMHTTEARPDRMGKKTKPQPRKRTSD